MELEGNGQLADLSELSSISSFTESNAKTNDRSEWKNILGTQRLCRRLVLIVIWICSMHMDRLYQKIFPNGKTFVSIFCHRAPHL